MSRILPVTAIVMTVLAGSASFALAVPPSKPADAGAAPPADAAKVPEPAKTESASPPASPPADKPSAATGAMSTAAEIKAKIIGNTVIGTMTEGGAYTEFYDPDGTIVGSDFTGKWSFEGDKMCFVFDESKPKGCLDVKITDAKVSWMRFAVEIGTGIIVPGNPSKLTGAAAEPETPAPEAAAPAEKSEKVDMAALPCEGLVKGSLSKKEKEDLEAVMYWIAGYISPEELGTVLDPKAIKADIEKIKAQCRKQPKLGVLTTAKKIELTQHGRNAVDIATITCKSVKNTSEAEKGELGLKLLWLAGYFSFFNNDTIFDLGAFDKAGKSIGTYCDENPDVSIVTAAKKFMGAEEK